MSSEPIESVPFLLSDRPITPEQLLLMGFHENNSQQFAKGSVWSRLITRGQVNPLSSFKMIRSWVHVELVYLGTVSEASRSYWKCSVESLSLNARNMQDVADIIAVLEK